MQYFVEENNIVRKIWGNSDTILFIFAGASAEFALNKAVDWLYFTGKLPSNPLGRLFSTVEYARRIVFSPLEEANKAIDTMSHIHAAVEKSRGYSIPDWAYRDVLFMLIYYSIAAYELLQKKLTELQKEEVYDVFLRMGTRMGVKGLPLTYAEWLPVRDAHLRSNLAHSDFTVDLFKQYKKHLGSIRYSVLIEAQKLVVPKRVIELMNFGPLKLLSPIVPLYIFSRKIKLDKLFKAIILPSKYKKQIDALDMEK